MLTIRTISLLATALLVLKAGRAKSTADGGLKIDLCPTTSFRVLGVRLETDHASTRR